ncbi:MAG: molybdopterin-dependent oxidoreductase [Planctomycetia bacterium]|nr:molybdopterin-dependent oxidoreductase [Planctomycetia bacterium]
MDNNWRKTACILCSINCGIEVAVDGRRITRIRGDKAHPSSQGYTCEKAQRLDYYQNGRHRLTTPLRRRADGTFQPIDWDTAIREVAASLVKIRDTHGGDKIFYYGGGGQGNHLGGAYARATRAALGSIYTSNALAQEKTGEFWVDGQLYGRPRCHTTGDFEHAEVAVFVGKNPWQSHGFPRARVVLKEVAADPARTLIVIDPRRTETAELADYHLQVRPGGDAWCLSAMLGVLVQEDLIDRAFLAEHASNGEPLFEALRGIPIADYCARAGVPEEQVRAVARRIAGAASVSMFEDLGIQQAPHSTLNSYLEKLIYLLTGNFAKRGAMNIHTGMASLGGGGKARTSPVTGQRIITGLIPCNAIPDEILTDHPNRFQAMIVESTNPVHSLADSQRMRAALDALECVVVIDVALTETARHAHYVLPASSQFEKWEATFFNLEFPENVFHLRAPLFDPLPDTLAEPEIHSRLVRAIGGLRPEDLAPLHAAAAQGRAAYGATFMQMVGERPDLAGMVSVILYETLGPTLGPGRAAAALLWGAAHTCAMSFPESVRRAGFTGEGFEPGERLFEAILNSRSGVTFTIDEYEDTWKRLATRDGRVNLAVPELLAELARLAAEQPARDPRFPFVLTAGERRSSTANTVLRNPASRGKEAAGALRISPADAESLGVTAGARVRVTTKRGAAETVVEITDRMQSGHVSLPNGQGLVYPGDDGHEAVHGVAPNELTASDHRDWLAGTPWHKHVPARVEAVAAAISD